MQPELWIIAGPNGAGKSCIARSYFPEGLPFINADDIAFEMVGSYADIATVSVAAGREALRRRRSYFDAGVSFAMETTFSGRGMVALVEGARRRGYYVRLIFVGLQHRALSMARVSQRVLLGGHFVIGLWV